MSPADLTSFGTTEELEELSIGESKCLWKNGAGLMAGSKQKPGCKMTGLLSDGVAYSNRGLYVLG